MNLEETLEKIINTPSKEFGLKEVIQGCKYNLQEWKNSQPNEDNYLSKCEECCVALDCLIDQIEGKNEE